MSILFLQCFNRLTTSGLVEEFTDTTVERSDLSHCERAAVAALFSGIQSCARSRRESEGHVSGDSRWNATSQSVPAIRRGGSASHESPTLTAKRIEAFVATLGDEPIWKRFSG
jgi:hypothetical protein